MVDFRLILRWDTLIELFHTEIWRTGGHSPSKGNEYSWEKRKEGDLNWSRCRVSAGQLWACVKCTSPGRGGNVCLTWLNLGKGGQWRHYLLFPNRFYVLGSIFSKNKVTHANYLKQWDLFIPQPCIQIVIVIIQGVRKLVLQAVCKSDCIGEKLIFI